MKNTKIALIGLATAAFAAPLFAANSALRPARPEPEAVVVEMLADYDADNSSSLDATELAAAFNGLRASHMADRQGKRPGPDKSDGNKRANKNSDTADRPRDGSGKRGPRNPADIAPQLVADFDKDGDAALNSEELYRAITHLQATRPGPGKPRGPRSGE